MSRQATYFTLVPGTWTKIADFTGDSAGPPLIARVIHMDSTSADYVEVVASPTQGDAPVAGPGVGVRGFPVMPGTFQDFGESIGNAQGGLTTLWAKCVSAVEIAVAPVFA